MRVLNGRDKLKSTWTTMMVCILKSLLRGGEKSLIENKLDSVKLAVGSLLNFRSENALIIYLSF